MEVEIRLDAAPRARISIQIDASALNTVQQQIDYHLLARCILQSLNFVKVEVLVEGKLE